MKMILTAVLAAVSFMQMAKASVITSGDPYVFLKYGQSPTVVQGPPQANCPYCYPEGFTYISDGDTGYGGTDNTTRLGLVFTANEIFNVPVESTFNFQGFGDDTATFNLFGPQTIYSLGSGDFTTPVNTTLDLSPGFYLLKADVFSMYPGGAATNNFTVVAWNGVLTPTTDTVNDASAPEPSTWFMFGSGAVLLFFGSKRKLLFG